MKHDRRSAVVADDEMPIMTQAADVVITRDVTALVVCIERKVALDIDVKYSDAVVISYSL